MQKLLIKEESARVKENRDLLQQEWVIHAVNSEYPEILQICQQDYTKKTAQLLHKLELNVKLTGYRCLICAIPMVADNPSVLLKEIYPDIAKQCCLSDYRCVERTIRSAIWKAWENRDDAVWSQYFPRNKAGEIIRPTNKEFIARLAEEL